MEIHHYNIPTLKLQDRLNTWQYLRKSWDSNHKTKAFAYKSVKMTIKKRALVFSLGSGEDLKRARKTRMGHCSLSWEFWPWGKGERHRIEMLRVSLRTCRESVLHMKVNLLMPLREATHNCILLISRNARKRGRRHISNGKKMALLHKSN